MDHVIKTQGLCKSYRGHTVVNNVSINIRKGDIYGLIGRNGAGKTTLMKLLLGISVPDKGSIEFASSEDPGVARSRIGSLIEEPALYKNESAFENLKRFSCLVPAEDDELKRILKLVGLENTGNKKVKNFSLGMRQRLGIAVALLGHPDILILDEPVNGLDPEGIKEVRDIILGLNKAGVTFMISSHLLDELGKIATVYGVMSNGVITTEIRADELANLCRGYVKMTVDRPDAAVKVLSEYERKLSLEKSENEIRILSEPEDVSELNRVLVENGIRVSGISVVRRDPEDFFIEKMR